MFRGFIGFVVLTVSWFHGVNGFMGFRGVNGFMVSLGSWFHGFMVS